MLLSMKKFPENIENVVINAIVCIYIVTYDLI